MKSDFFDSVHKVAVLIPEGRVTSYGAIAKYLGAARSSRMVGYAMNQCVDKPHIPAHRVVNRNGVLSGRHHFANPFRMQELLEAEGTKVIDDTVVDFNEKFWDPAAELGLDKTSFHNS